MNTFHKCSFIFAVFLCTVANADMIDASLFMAYNTNMRNLVYDKLKSVETVVFNRISKETDKMPFHQIIRAANRRCEIIYEYGPDDMEFVLGW